MRRKYHWLPTPSPDHGFFQVSTFPETVKNSTGCLLKSVLQTVARTTTTTGTIQQEVGTSQQDLGTSQQELRTMTNQQELRTVNRN